MIFLYSLCIYLFLPFILMYLFKRSLKNPQYFKKINERFAYYKNNNNLKSVIWVHAVSVGEVMAVKPVIENLQNKYFNDRILLTVTTPTGREIANKIFKNIQIVYLAYDAPIFVKRFYKLFSPKIALIMETEIWPNYLIYAKKLNIPIYLINARLSNKSLKNYMHFKSFFSSVINNFTAILCQDQNTYDNFKKLNYHSKLIVAGNTKFDVNQQQINYSLIKLLKQFIFEKKIVIFASTREKEHSLIINNLNILNNYLVIIVPRHIEQFVVVEKLLQQKNINYQLRSDNEPINLNTQVLLGNSIGEMSTYYSMSDIVVIGGSFAQYGGQNLIEPLKLNKPVIFGSYMFNFAQIAKNAIEEKCAIQVENIESCMHIVNKILNDNKLYSEYANNATKFIAKYIGATVKIISTISVNL